MKAHGFATVTNIGSSTGIVCLARESAGNWGTSLLPASIIKVGVDEKGSRGVIVVVRIVITSTVGRTTVIFVAVAWICVSEEASPGTGGDGRRRRFREAQGLRRWEVANTIVYGELLVDVGLIGGDWEGKINWVLGQALCDGAVVFVGNIRGIAKTSRWLRGDGAVGLGHKHQ
jgi:hypothetical protein